MKKSLIFLFIIYNFTCSICTLTKKESNKLNNELIVTGTASTTLDADTIKFIGRFETSYKDKQVTIDENLKIINKIYEVIEKFKIRIVSYTYGVFPEYLPISTKQEVYIYINEFELILTDKNSLKPLIETVGNNTLTINSINFSVSEELIEKTKNSLIEAAGKNAYEKSTITAKTFNITIKEVKSIKVSDYFIKTNYFSYTPEAVNVKDQSFNIAQVDVLQSIYGGWALITSNIFVTYGY